MGVSAPIFSHMLNRGVIAALNHLLDAAPWARDRLVPFAGKKATFVMSPLRLSVQVQVGGLFVAADGEAADVDITLPLDPLLGMQGKDALMRQARVSGSADFADALRFVLQNLRWDFEEDLSRFVGDIAAHRIAETVSVVGLWQRRAAQSAAENLVHYLRDERPSLVMPRDARMFVDAVDHLRDDLARLEKRIEMLAASAPKRRINPARR